MPVRRRSFLCLALAVCTLTAPGAPVAIASDTLTLNDGRTFHGRLISDDGTTVTFEVHAGGAQLKARYPHEQVRSTEQESRKGPSYCALPIVGSIGRVKGGGPPITARAFKSALAEARKAHPDYVVLVIDSPGGSLQEMAEIVGAIHDAKDLHFIAYVRRAISAAAVIAMTCPTICTSPDGLIGAAVPYQIGPDGTPANIEEKFQSIIRATCRQATTLGGHSPLLMQGMMETDVELAVVTRDGHPVVVEAASARNALKIKSKGEILTLTAPEAERCGLSRGIAASIAEVAARQGLDAWHAADDRAWYALANAAKAEQWRYEQELARLNAARTAAAQQARTQAGPSPGGR